MSYNQRNPIFSFRLVERERSKMDKLAKLDISSASELAQKIIVTTGSKGCEYDGNIYPVKEVQMKDSSGAGDTFLAGLVVEYLRTKDIVKSIKFAQECTTKVVQRHGVSTI